MSLYLTAEEAARELGVSVGTLYAYVSRKGIRTERTPGARERLYWKTDVLAARSRRGGGPVTPAPDGVSRESALTFIAEHGPYYRGRSAVELAETMTVEEVAGLLWGVDPKIVFSERLPNVPENYAALMALVDSASAVDRSTVMLPFIEAANPRAFDLSPAGMAATGADLLRFLAAILTRDAGPSADPLHLYLGRRLGLSDDWTDLARRLLVLSADHGLASGTYAVRAVASVGVSPFRSALAGLTISSGRRTSFGRYDSLGRLLKDISVCADPASLIVSRLREGDRLPGFGFSPLPQGDPRATALFQRLDEICDDDVGYRRLKIAIATMDENSGLKPDFALTTMFATQRMNMDPRDSLFFIGRAIGWVAHSIEQYQTGEIERSASAYVGELPEGHRRRSAP